MQDPSKLYLREIPGLEYSAAAFLSKAADANQPFGLQYLQQASQMLVTDIFQGPPRIGWKLIGGDIASRAFHENQRAIIDDEMLLKKCLGRCKLLLEQSPQAAAGNFASRAVPALNGTLGMLAQRSADGSIDFQEFADGRYFTKGNACLSHPPRPGIHAQEKNATTGQRVPLPKLTMRFPGVFQRVVDPGNACVEPQFGHVLAELLCVAEQLPIPGLMIHPNTTWHGTSRIVDGKRSGPHQPPTGGVQF